MIEKVYDFELIDEPKTEEPASVVEEKVEEPVVETPVEVAPEPEKKPAAKKPATHLKACSQKINTKKAKGLLKQKLRVHKSNKILLGGISKYIRE